MIQLLPVVYVVSVLFFWAHHQHYRAQLIKKYDFGFKNIFLNSSYSYPALACTVVAAIALWK